MKGGWGRMERRGQAKEGHMKARHTIGKRADAVRRGASGRWNEHDATEGAS